FSPYFPTFLGTNCLEETRGNSNTHEKRSFKTAEESSVQSDGRNHSPAGRWRFTSRWQLTASVNGHVGLGFLFAQRLPFLRRQFLRFEDHDELLERAREGKRHLVDVVLDHVRSGVCADIERLVEREADSDRLGNLPFRDLLAVNEQGSGCALADAAAVVLEGETHDVLARRDRLVGGDAELVIGLVGKGIGEGR